MNKLSSHVDSSILHFGSGHKNQISPEELSYIYRNRNTGSTYNIDKSTAAKISTLFDGTTKQQVAADLLATIGVPVGSSIGFVGAKKQFSKAIDALVDHAKNIKLKALNDFAKETGTSVLSRIPGDSVSNKLLKLPLYKFTIAKSFLKGLPKNVKYPGLMGLSLVLGGGLAGGVTGGVIGHHIYKPDDMPSS